MWKFPTKQRIFQNILGFAKNSRYFPKKLEGFEKNPQSFGGNVPQVASQKPGKKTP